MLRLHIAENFFKVHVTQEYRRRYRENKEIDNKIRLLMKKDLKEKRQNIKSIIYNIPLFEHQGKKNTINFIKHFIKHVKNNIQNFKFNEELNINIRSLSMSIIDKLFNNFFLSYNDKILSSMYNSTKTFMKQNPEVLVTRADKGSITVALNNKKYIIHTMLSDSSTYEVVNYDPLKKIINSLTTMISGWKQKEYIDIYTYRRIYCGDGNLPRAYGLPKTHKPNCPLRIIGPTINSPLFSLAIFLKNVLQESLDRSLGFVSNSYQLIRELNGFKMEPNYKLVSLNVTSLFTNVPIDLAMESIERIWVSVSHNTFIPLQKFKSAVKFVLNSTSHSTTYVINKFSALLWAPRYLL